MRSLLACVVVSTISLAHAAPTHDKVVDDLIGAIKRRDPAAFATLAQRDNGVLKSWDGLAELVKRLALDVSTMTIDRRDCKATESTVVECRIDGLTKSGTKLGLLLTLENKADRWRVRELDTKAWTVELEQFADSLLAMVQKRDRSGYAKLIAPTTTNPDRHLAAFDRAVARLELKAGAKVAITKRECVQNDNEGECDVYFEVAGKQLRLDVGECSKLAQGWRVIGELKVKDVK